VPQLGGSNCADVALLSHRRSVLLKAPMAFREAILHGSTTREHIVQLFDTVESLGETVAKFVTEGLAADDLVLVVARPHAWTNVAAGLARSGVDVRRAVDVRQLVVLDAATTLSKFTRQSWPDSERFEAVIGGLVRELVGRGRLRIYGEMVDVLAADAQFHAAVALEKLWNDLAKTTPFSLFCGYSAVTFGSQRNSEMLRLICRCHSETRVNDDDDLAAWLLSRGAEDDVAFSS
jgi:DcmR-like sensory protein